MLHNQTSLGAGTAGAGGWRRKAREVRLTARRMFTNDGLAVACRQRNLPPPISNILQGEDLKTKMLALNFKNSR